MSDELEELRAKCREYEAEFAADPEDGAALYNWALALDGIKELSHDPAEVLSLQREVCAKYEQADAIDPDDVYTLTNWGVALGELAALIDDLGERRALLEREVELHRRTLELDPEEFDSLNNWGATLWQLAELAEQDGEEQRRVDLLEEAIELYERAFELDENDAELHSNWAQALFDLALLEPGAEGVALLREACEHDERSLDEESDPEVAHHLARVLAEWAERERNGRATRLRRAIEACERASELDPESTLAQHDAGEYELRLAELAEDPSERERLEQAGLDRLERANAYTDDPDRLEDWARALIRVRGVGGVDLARAKLRRAAELREMPVEHSYDWACLLAISGDAERAVASLEHALRRGEVDADEVRHDSDWAGLASRKDWIDLLARYDV